MLKARDGKWKHRSFLLFCCHQQQSMWTSQIVLLNTKILDTVTLKSPTWTVYFSPSCVCTTIHPSFSAPKHPALCTLCLLLTSFQMTTSLPVLKTSRTAGTAAAAQFSPFPHRHTIILPILSSFPPRSGHWTVTNLLIISRALGQSSYTAIQQQHSSQPPPPQCPWTKQPFVGPWSKQMKKKKIGWERSVNISEGISGILLQDYFSNHYPGKTGSTGTRLVRE